MMTLIKPQLFGIVAALAVSASAANAVVVRVAEGDFQAAAGLITFSEFSLGTVNPTYLPADYGSVTGPTVSFGGWFLGQSLSATPAVDCPGAAATACVVGTPTAGLSLDPLAQNTFITTDGSAPNSPVLSGSPTFNGPIAILFSEDQYGVGFDAGYFNAAASTGITAFDRDGNILGTVANVGLGIEFLGLVSQDADIAGVFLDLVGSEPAGFAVDSIRFGTRQQVTVPSVPLPAGLPLLASGLVAIGLLRRRRKA
ncbi:VPLPA-CTERM sorting domain-containing protein [Tropicimonas sp. IMCC34043]|uniref:VPLPA-CTERM sorting domain-containing protein n=1 Tax=Tropicimonas sp. IMCC34043 TaxID=2248760 RepID=UPI000E28948C|nr:VPLPA-CTERM sorting domain-containing protein [Tropicimonas sp. IMCC34043]